LFVLHYCCFFPRKNPKGSNVTLSNKKRNKLTKRLQRRQAEKEREQAAIEGRHKIEKSFICHSYSLTTDKCDRAPPVLQICADR
jgi:hypothetical protein